MKAIILCLLFGLQLQAQTINNSLEIRAGHSLIPGDYVGLRYNLTTGYPFDFSIKAFIDKSRTHQLNYSAIGIDALIEFPFSIFRVGAGPTIQYESEPWVYRGRDFSRRINYGIATEASIECFLTDAFSLTAFANQKYLFSKDLGHFHFVFGIGLKYSFGN